MPLLPVARALWRTPCPEVSCNTVFLLRLNRFPSPFSPCSFQKKRRRRKKKQHWHALLPSSHPAMTNTARRHARRGRRGEQTERTTVETVEKIKMEGCSPQATGAVSTCGSSGGGGGGRRGPLSSYHSPLSSLKHAPMLSTRSSNVQPHDKAASRGRTSCTHRTPTHTHTRR